jgi:hypothetical protein
MKFGSISQREWRAFGGLPETISDIEEKCVRILEEIKDAFARSSAIGPGTCDFSLTGEERSMTVAVLTSPFGEGRFVRSWSRTANSLHAELVFQRAMLDKYDATYWEPTWSIQVPRFDVATSGSGDNSVHFTFSGYGDNDKNAGFSVAITILASLVDDFVEPQV